MRFTSTKIPGVVVVDIDTRADERGFFARSWDMEEAKAAGCDITIVQCNVSFNSKKGTLRGMHYQIAPYMEPKIVRCTRGAIYDVVLDLRDSSPTFKEWVAFELTEKNHRSVFIPIGCAHGFQTLKDNTEIFYLMGEYFHPESSRGVRWDDEAFKIDWPKANGRIISDKDRSYPDFHA